MMTPEESFELVQKHVEALGEHFDTVQIFITHHEGGEGTFRLQLGSGNFYARLGQIHEWLTRSDEQTKQFVRHEENE